MQKMKKAEVQKVEKAEVQKVKKAEVQEVKKRRCNFHSEGCKCPGGG
jgi:hypothetical protein